jgi:tRNA (guanine37-N1)-methyltransferase
LLKEHAFLKREMKISVEGELAFIPIKEAPPRNLLNNAGLGYVNVVEKIVEAGKTIQNFTSALEKVIPSKLKPLIPRSLDIIGHVAIVELPPELEPYAEALGKTVMETHRNVKTVLAKTSQVDSPFRLRKFKLISGIDQTETVHREFGCRFVVDVRKVYFSPRLSFEHDRVSAQIGEGETVVDMFAGVGPFSILTAKRRKKVKVYAIDANPEAYSYLLRNIAINKVDSKVTALLGDIQRLLEKNLRGVKADRVIMNLPSEAFRFLPQALTLLKAEGIVHYYCFAKEPNPLEKAEEEVKKTVAFSGWKADVLYARRVKPSAPRTWMVALDLRFTL